MRTLLHALATLLLVACSSPPAQQSALAADARASAPIIVATLATNACEARVAPVYTAAVVATERATRAVQRGQLSPDRAEVILELGRCAREDLDLACPGQQLDANRLAAAESSVATMQQILGGAP